MKAGTIPVTVVILTKNEETGIGETLRHLTRFAQVVVVDSHSSDRTRDIALDAGAEVIAFAWDGGYPKKKQWSIENSGARHEWILLLDADERPTPSLIDEIEALSQSTELNKFDAFDIHLSYRFAGRFLRHGHRVTKRSFLHRERAHFPIIDDLEAPGIREVEGHYQPVAQRLGKLQSRLMHDDDDPVSSWFDRHNRYSDWEAYLALDRGLKAEIASKRTAKGKLFDSVPFKPAAFFLYSYVVRAGFLDGRAGFDYAIALSTYYWQISLKTRELRRVKATGVQIS